MAYDNPAAPYTRGISTRGDTLCARHESAVTLMLNMRYIQAGPKRRTPSGANLKLPEERNALIPWALVEAVPGAEDAHSSPRLKLFCETCRERNNFKIEKHFAALALQSSTVPVYCTTGDTF